MALSDAIASLGGTVVYTVTHRANNGYDANGRAIASTASAGTIVGLMQPLTGKERDLLPEGLAEGEKQAFWTTGTLVTTDSDAGTEGDLVTADGVTWEVVLEERWGTFGQYRKYILARSS